MEAVGFISEINDNSIQLIVPIDNFDKYHIYGIALDKYLVKKLNM